MRESSKLSETPSSAHLKKLIDELDATKSVRSMDPALVQEYRKVVGSLLYSTCAVRPDASYAVGQLCRCLTCPDARALAEAYRVLRYLADSQTLTLTFDGTKGLHILAYTDADWDAKPSTTGYIIMVCGGPVAWKSVKQRCVTMSSCEAELVAANAAGGKCVYIRNLVTDLMGIDIPTPPLQVPEMKCDNQGTIDFSRNPASLGRMKHLERSYLKIREWLSDKLFSLSHVTTKRNIADCLTKSLCPSLFTKLRQQFMYEAQA